jgi:hypothetical protein
MITVDFVCFTVTFYPIFQKPKGPNTMLEKILTHDKGRNAKTLVTYIVPITIMWIC